MRLLRDAVNIQVATVTTTADGVEQSLYFVGREDKASLLAHLYKSLPMYRSIVFTRTKRGADRVVKRLHAAVFMPRRFTATRPKARASGR